ncbi:MAG: spore germination protein GerW family protein [Eubacteriales bacterium]
MKSHSRNFTGGNAGKDIIMQEERTEQNRISELIKESLESVRGLVDANTIIGNPINTPQGTVIIPISKISVGFAGGGNDYAGKNSPQGRNNFGGGGGTGVSVTPVGFLVINESGKAEMLTMNNPTGNDVGASVESIVNKLPSIVEKLKAALGKKKKDKEEKSEEKEENTEEKPQDNTSPISKEEAAEENTVKGE